MRKDIYISIVLPVYNESDRINAFVWPQDRCWRCHLAAA